MDVKLNLWPNSQVCVTCKFSIFFNPDNNNNQDEIDTFAKKHGTLNSAYICLKNKDAEICQINVT